MAKEKKFRNHERKCKKNLGACLMLQVCVCGLCENVFSLLCIILVIFFVLKILYTKVPCKETNSLARNKILLCFKYFFFSLIISLLARGTKTNNVWWFSFAFHGQQWFYSAIKKISMMAKKCIKINWTIFLYCVSIMRSMNNVHFFSYFFP